MKPLSPWHVLNSMLTALVVTAVIVFPFLAVYFMGTNFGNGDETGVADADFHDDCAFFLEILALFIVVALVVIVYTNLRSRLPRDIDYSRDLPAMSPGCATLLNDIVDPPSDMFSRVVNIGSSAMAATLLELQEKKVIAIYPGVAADYEGFDLHRPDDAGLQGRMREVAETQRSFADAAAQNTADASNGNGSRESSRGQGRHYTKRPMPMSGILARLLWNTALGSKLRMNAYSQSWLGDINQPSDLVSTICLLPLAFEGIQTSNNLKDSNDPNGLNEPNHANGLNAPNSLRSLSSTERAFLRFLMDFSRWQRSTVFDLNQLRTACAAEAKALEERMQSEERSKHVVEVKDGEITCPQVSVSFDGLFRGYRPQAKFFQTVRGELQSSKLVAYNMGPLIVFFLAMAIVIFLGAPPLMRMWDADAGYTAIGLGALGCFIGITMLFCVQAYALTAEGKRAAIQLLGLKKYMRDFSDFSSRGIADVEVWGQYLIYATALGLSERTNRQLSVYIYLYAVMETYNYYGTDYESIVMGDSANSSGASNETYTDSDLLDAS
ncbi:DUF2207 domain-containing protein [Bifidobacterium sp. ESL0784]|uniref:DUF2207 family protein n=1 Tax=Bifidobacterium sp. ESL0784 TaxID=2983231 RepID=UPI0023F6F635|nr:DUF2207 domain-containing protein [Bifidobacterium sp. ESL0784]MDF7640611.1 DUF2207 domain-containing protein [Bifidobacterium sp. ESL0784]